MNFTGGNGFKLFHEGSGIVPRQALQGKRTKVKFFLKKSEK